MNEKLLNALETCLQALEQGETLDSVLARFPALAADLRPILDASLHARTLSGPPPSDAVQRRGRARLLQRAAEMREAKRAPKRTWLYNFRPLAVTLMLVIFFLSGTGLVRASSGALPGDNLYGVKRTWEGVRLLLTLNAEVRETLELEYGNERLHEIDELLAEGREEPVTFSGHVTAQNSDVWTVAGVPVRISSQTRLPEQPIETGAGLRITGRTDTEGFLVADTIDLLPPGATIPPIDNDGGDDHDEDDDETLTASPTPIPTGTPVPFPTATGTATATESANENGNENGNENENKNGNENENENENGNENENENDNDNNNG